MAAQAVGIATKALENNRGLEIKLGDKLEAGGLAIRPAEWLLIHAGIALGAAAVGMLLSGGSLLFAAVALLLGIVLPWLYLGRKQSKRLKAFNTQLAPTMQLMAGSLQAGLSLPQGMDTIVREGAEPMATEFRRALVETRLGVSIEDSLESIGERMTSDDFRWAVMAIRIQREVGGNLAELLLNVAGTLREREYLRRQVKSLSAEGRFSAYILLSMPPAIMALRVRHEPGLPATALHHRDRLRHARRHVCADGARQLHDEPHDQVGDLMPLLTVLLVLGIAGIFAGLFLSMTAVGVFTNEARGVSKSLAVIEAFSAAPQSMQDELAPGFQDRVLSPFIDRFTSLGRRLTPVRLQRAHPRQAQRGREPAGMDRGSRPVPEGHRHRSRPGRRGAARVPAR